MRWNGAGSWPCSRSWTAGGKIYGELDTLGFATVAEGIDDPTPPAGRSRDHVGQDPDDRAVETAKTRGRRRADRLVELCARDLHARGGDGGALTDELPADGKDRTVPPTTILATVSLETLLGLSDQPGSLLTKLTGGQLRLATPPHQLTITHRPPPGTRTAKTLTPS
jgi:hypothetical protein